MAIIEGVLANFITDLIKLAGAKISRNDKIRKALKNAGFLPERPQPDFESVYFHALAEFGVEEQEPVLRLFENPEIQNLFEKGYRSNHYEALKREAASQVNLSLAGENLEAVLERFEIVFKEMIARSQPPGEARRQCIQEEMLDILKSGAGAKEISIEQRRCLLEEYLKDVAADTAAIDIQGIYSELGSGKKAISFPIEEHYTPLKTVLPSGPHIEMNADCEGRQAGAEARRVPLTDLLSARRRLLIVGEPGGGKTTFLRFIACVLAKDALNRPDPERERRLGIPLSVEAPIPILIRISTLAAVIRGTCTDGCAGGGWQVLTQTLEKLYGPEKASILEESLNAGRCALLLDGLDEEADAGLRKRLMSVAGAIVTHYGAGNFFVISTRPFGYQAVAALEGITTAHIDSFDEPEIAEFLERWAGALFPDEEQRRKEAYLPELRAEVLHRRRIRAMAKNPVMLTCLCVIHWNERKLPEGKADVLKAILRWMLAAKTEKRRARGYHNEFAEECFKTLALAMTIHPDGKTPQVDLVWAAEQLAPPFRDELGIEGDRLRKKGVEFLEAEMIDSGIVEQAGIGQIRFWHYTFQDHYAATALVEKTDDDAPEGWWAAIRDHLDDRQWDEVVEHFAGCLAKTGRRRLNLLIERILGSAETGDLASTALAVGVLGRLLFIKFTITSRRHDWDGKRPVNGSWRFSPKRGRRR